MSTTGTSDTYKSQVSQLATDLKYWQEYIEQVSGVVQTFSSTITELQDKIDEIDNKLDGLIENVSTFMEDTNANISTLFSYHPDAKRASTSYINLSTSGVEIEASSKAGYAKSIGIFSNVQFIYVYANKSYDNVTFNGATIKSADETKQPFTSFSSKTTIRSATIKGNLGGNVIKKIETQKGAYAGKVTLYFSDSSTFKTSIYQTATKLDITVNRNIKDNFNYLRTGSIPTALTQAIDLGINANNINKSILNTNLSATEAISKNTGKTPTAITNVATAANVKTSSSVINRSSSTSVVRSSGQTKSVTTKNNTTTSSISRRKLR